MKEILSGGELGPAPVPTLAAALEAAAGSDAVWLTFHRDTSARTLSFAEAFRLARRWASALRAAGVGRGDRVAVI